MTLRLLPILFFGLGCEPNIITDHQATIDYDVFLEACADTFEGTTPLVVQPIPGDVLGGCASIVGEVLGIEWVGFDAQANDTHSPTSPVGLLLTGFLAATDPQSPATADIISDEMPVSIYAVLNEYSESPYSGRLWYEFIQSAVDKTVYDPFFEYQMGFSNGTLYIGDITNENDIFGIDEDVPAVSGMLIHESGHSIYPEHVPCADNVEDECDANRESAYALHAWWLYQNLQAYRYEMDDERCDLVYYHLSFTCSRLNVSEGYLPCEPESLERSCDTEGT
jgi:hypothetical protein